MKLFTFDGHPTSLSARRAELLAAQAALNVSHIAVRVSARAAERAPHLVLVLDRSDPTANELLTSYAPPHLQLARGACDDLEIIALAVEDGLNLLRAPRHHPTVFRVVADQVADEPPGIVQGICIAGGGFRRFVLREAS